MATHRSGHIAAALFNLDLHIQLAALRQVCDHMIRIDNLDIMGSLNVTGCNKSFSVFAQAQGHLVTVVKLEHNALEDVVNILLNLKGVVFKLHNRDEVTLSLRKDGEGLVTASDIQTPHDVEIINPDHVIAHLSQSGKLDMQIKVEKGRGYIPGTMRRHGDEPTKSIGRIILDASFSPVKRVSYTVESARVEQRTDLDKLVVDIETNGAISAEDAVRASAKILVEQLAVF